jgi:hypothetical protein
LGRKSKTEIEFVENPSDLNILEDLVKARQVVETGKISIIPSIYATDDSSIMFVSLKNFNRLKRAFSDRPEEAPESIPGL